MILNSIRQYLTMNFIIATINLYTRCLQVVRQFPPNDNLATA
jgi:hypothetical protein